MVAPFTASTRWGSLGVAADTISLSQGARSVSVARLEGSGSATAFAGPFRVDARVTSGAWVTSDASGAGASGAAATATLAEEARLGWRPRCGCVDVTALGAHRVGREGIDVMLTAALFR